MVYSNFLRGDYPQTTPNAQEGLITQIADYGILTIPNKSGRTARQAVITPGVATAEITVYRLTENVTGQTITFTSDASPTAAEVVTGLKAAFQANAILNGIATVSGTSTLIVTSRQSGSAAGILFDFVDGGSTPTNVLTVATTAGQDAAIVPITGVGMAQGTDGVVKIPSAALSSSNVFAGIVGYVGQSDLHWSVESGEGYRADDAMPLLRNGQICIKPLSAVDPTKSVYLFHTGTNAGKFSAVSDTDNSLVSACRWETVTALGDLALLNVRI